MNQALLAITVATRAHAGQKRKDGTPYIGHPMRVMYRTIQRGGTEDEIIASVLHDTVEDTSMTLEELRELGFSANSVRLVDAVTKRPGESYSDFIRRIKNSGEQASGVKLDDIADNMEDQSALDPEEAAFLYDRYIKARKVLNGSS